MLFAVLYFFPYGFKRINPIVDLNGSIKLLFGHIISVLQRSIPHLRKVLIDK